MIAVTVTYSLRLGERTAFTAALSRFARDSAAEETGCLRADVLSDPARPGKAMLVQVFADQAAFEAFRVSSLARDFDSAVVDMVTTRTILTWSEVSTIRAP